LVYPVDISVDTERSAPIFMSGSLGRNRSHTSAARIDWFHFAVDGRWIFVSRHWLGWFDRNMSTPGYRPCVGQLDDRSFPSLPLRGILGGDCVGRCLSLFYSP